jgi:hypothetical protein
MQKGTRPKCLWCGNPMSQNYRTTEEGWDWNLHRHLKQTHGEEWFEMWLKDQRKPTGTYGKSGNGWFCSLRCGFAWAVNSLREKER